MSVIDPQQVRRVLMIRLSALGDVVNALPALSALRQMLPAAHIAWAVEEPLDDIVTGHPMLDEVIVIPRKRWTRSLRQPGQWGAAWEEASELRTRLRKERFDVSLDLQGNFRSGLVTWLCGARHRVGFGSNHSKEMSHLACNHRVSLPQGTLHRIERGLKLISCLGEVPSELETIVPIGPEPRSFAEAFFSGHFSEADRVAVLHPGVSKFGSYKQWPEERYAELAGLLDRQLGVKCLLTWGPGERDMCERIASRADVPLVLAPETKSIGQLAALIQLAALFVGADSGPARLAWAVGVPEVVIFGPKDSAVYGPNSGAYRVVELEMPCRPCRKRTCPDPICVTGIDAGRVFESARELLAI